MSSTFDSTSFQSCSPAIANVSLVASTDAVLIGLTNPPDILDLAGMDTILQ